MLVIFIKSCFGLCIEDLCHIPLWDLTFLFQHLMFWYLSNLKYVFSHFFTSYSWQLLMVWLKFWVSSGCRVLDLNTYRMTQSSCTQPCLVFARYSELCILASPCKLRSAGSLQYFTLRKKDQRALWYNTAFTQLPLATRYVYKKGIFFSYSFSLTGRVEFSVHIAGRQKAHPREILDSSEKNPLFAKLQCNNINSF